LRFEPCSDDSAIAGDIVDFDQHLADMDADAKAQPFGLIEAGVVTSVSGLRGDRALHCIIATL
tara:strand:- start:1612 stop:1800 length:189 start_codon:yes stop_codon:yes gene_type:complete